MKEYKAHAKRMRRLIRDTMISLLEEKSFTEITVQDILNRAEIQRASFYRYFRDKYEVAEEINHFLTDYFAHNFFANFYRGEPCDKDGLLEFWSKYRTLIQTMLFLQIEKVNLLEELQDTFISEYRVYYPDSTNYEAYLAAHNFLSMFVYPEKYTLSITELNELLQLDSQLCWLARYYNIPISNFRNFIEQNKGLSKQMNEFHRKENLQNK